MQETYFPTFLFLIHYFCNTVTVCGFVVTLKPPLFSTSADIVYVPLGTVLRYSLNTGV
jgi:hypothetical protein